MNRRKFFAGLAVAPVLGVAGAASAKVQVEPLVCVMNADEVTGWIQEAADEFLRGHAAKSIRLIRAVSRGKMSANEAARALRA